MTNFDLAYFLLCRPQLRDCETSPGNYKYCCHGTEGYKCGEYGKLREPGQMVGESMAEIYFMASREKFTIVWDKLCHFPSSSLHLSQARPGNYTGWTRTRHPAPLSTAATGGLLLEWVRLLLICCCVTSHLSDSRENASVL